MPDINITVAHKVAVSDTQSIVCDNSDYTVHWTLDEDWSAYDTKTMRTIYMDGTYKDTVFNGDVIALPVCTVPGVVQIGLFAGDIRASRMAIMRALPSVRSAAGAPEDPEPNVYDQIMEIINGLGGVDPDDIAKAVADYLAAHPIGETDPTVPEWAKAKITGATVGQIAKIAAVDSDGKPTAWEPVDMASGGGTIQEVKLTAVVSAEQSLTIDNRAAEQTVNLAWDTPDGKTIPAFTNHYVAKNNIPYPRAFDTNGYTQTWSNANFHGNADAFVHGHKYFCAMEYEMDGDSTAKISGWGISVTPSGTDVISGSGWVYGVETPENVTATYFMLSRTSSGTGTIKHLYCIDVTALFDAGAISSVAINDLVALFGGLDLVPGENFAGETISGTATLTITSGDTQQLIDSPASTATIKGGDMLSVSAGTVTFVYVTTKITGGGTAAEKPWADKKWCAFGDSLTDPTINATTKYHAIIAAKTGISVTVLGKGGTGYYKTKDDGTAYYQRMANCPADADVITIFGSVNDWNAIKNGGLTIGNPSDAMSAGTYSGYVNECIDVAISKAPYAQIALVTPMDYHGLPDETLESIANALLAVAKYRKIKCLDLYHTSGFRVDNAAYAQTYTTDYTTTADTYGHPSNVAHERLIAPAVFELLKKMMLYG
jgi:hypothetical protein